jgi:septum formation protein
VATTPDPGEAALPRLVLASGSPRRRDLLRSLGIDFSVRPVELDESVLEGEEPEPYVERLARAKSAARCERGELVLAADTTVAVDGRILGKPGCPDETREMLGALSGRAHRVFTGIALAHSPNGGPEDELRSAVVATIVCFAPLSARVIDWYVATGEGDDKAGAYGIQGPGALFVEAVEGNYANVVGLPLPQVEELFGGLGCSLLDFRSRAG